MNVFALFSAPCRLVFLLTTLLILGSATTAFADSRLAIGGTAYYESSRLQGEEVISIQERDESFDYRNANFLSARIIYLRPRSERLSLGAGLDFIGTYRATILEEDGPADPPQRFEFGPLLEGFLIGEYGIELTEEFNLGLGATAGVAALFPRGDLAAEIRELRDDNVTALPIPRTGISAGAHAALSWRIDDRLALRADLGVQWQTLFLFFIRQNVEGTPFEKTWSTGALRTRLGLALEVTL